VRNGAASGSCRLGGGGSGTPRAPGTAPRTGPGSTARPSRSSATRTAPAGHVSKWAASVCSAGATKSGGTCPACRRTRRTLNGPVQGVNARSRGGSTAGGGCDARTRDLKYKTHT